MSVHSEYEEIRTGLQPVSAAADMSPTDLPNRLDFWKNVLFDVITACTSLKILFSFKCLHFIGKALPCVGEPRVFLYSPTFNTNITASTRALRSVVNPV